MLSLALHSKDKYNGPPDEEISAELSRPYQIDESLAKRQKDLIHKISNILSNDIHPKPSIFQNIIDLYLELQISWQEFLTLPGIVRIKKAKPKLFDAIKDFKIRFDSIAFKSIQEYIVLNKAPFPGDCNDILNQFLWLYDRVKVLQSVEDTAILYMSHHLFTRENECKTDYIDEEEECESSDDDDAGSGYDENITNFHNKLENWETMQHYPKQIYGPDGESKYDYSENSMDNILRFLIPNDQITEMKSNEFKHFQMIFRPNYLEGFEIFDSEISHYGMKSKFNVYQIINAVHCPYTKDNGVTFLLMKYPDDVDVYMIKRGWDGCKYQWYGWRVTVHNLCVIFPKLFENELIDISGNLIRRLFISAKDTVLEQFRSEITNKPITKSHNLYNSFEPHIIKILQASGSGIGLEEILRIFEIREITRDYFIDGNRDIFIHLLQEENVPTHIANELWVGLGGSFDNNNDEILMDDIEKEKETDLNLHELS